MTVRKVMDSVSISHVESHAKGYEANNTLLLGWKLLGWRPSPLGWRPFLLDSFCFWSVPTKRRDAAKRVTAHLTEKTGSVSHAPKRLPSSEVNFAWRDADSRSENIESKKKTPNGLVPKTVTMASNLLTMASSLIAMASNLLAMASSLIAMASNLKRVAGTPLDHAAPVQGIQNECFLFPVFVCVYNDSSRRVCCCPLSSLLNLVKVSCLTEILRQVRPEANREWGTHRSQPRRRLWL